VTERVLQRLGRALGLSSPSPSRSRSVTKRRVAPGVAKIPPKEDLREQLKTLLAGQSNILAGTMNFIGLADLEKRLGDQWPKMAERVNAIATKMIERRLTKADVYFPFGTLNFLIVFSRLSEAAARLKCAAIAAEIEKALLGEASSGRVLRVQTAVKQVDGELALVELETIDDLVARVFRGSGAEPREKRATGAAPSSGPELLDPAVQLVYRPVWDVRKDAVSAFLCHHESAAAIGDRQNPFLTNVEELDRCILGRAVNDMRGMTLTRRRFLLIIPVHFETLARRRVAYVKQCQTLPDIQEKLVIFELLGVPDGVPQSRLLEITGIVKPFARAIMMQVPLTRTSFFEASDTGLFAVGTYIGLQNGTEPQVMAAMDRFAAAANKAGLRTYAHALPSLSLASAAIGAGFDYIDADVISPAMTVPGEVRRFGIRDLYGKLQRCPRG
jgi:hypothetical protein